MGTVGFAMLSISRDDFARSGPDVSEGLIIAYTLFNAFATMMSFMAVVHGAQSYNYYNSTPAEMMDRALAASRHWNVAPMVYTAVIAQCIGAVLGVLLLYDTPNGIVVSGVFVV